MDGWCHGGWIFPLFFMAMCFFGWFFCQPRYRERNEVRELKEEIRSLKEEVRSLKK